MVASRAKCIVFVVRKDDSFAYIIRIAAVMFNECVKYVSSAAYNNNSLLS